MRALDWDIGSNNISIFGDYGYCLGAEQSQGRG